MKILYLSLMWLVAGLAPASADAPKDFLAEGPTVWPGIDYQILALQRIPPDRLIVGIRLMATPKAPAGGTLIGFPVPVPKDARPADISAGMYTPRPLSLMTSIMVDDITKTQYPALAPVAPPGHSYIPGVALGRLRPGESKLMTVQFAVPPPPPPPPAGQPPPKPTISFLFTQAKDYIRKIGLPPADGTELKPASTK